MRLGFITTSYPRYAGDPSGSFVQASARWLVERGHDVTVVCAGDASATASDGLIEVCRVDGSDIFFAGGAPDTLSASWRDVGRAAVFSTRLAVTARARLRDCDALISHWLLPSLPAALLVGTRMPIVAVAHSGDVDLAIRLRLVKALAHIVVRRDVDLVFVSRALQERFCDELSPTQANTIRSRSRVCAMGFAAGAVAASSHVQPVAARPRQRVVFIGRLVQIKGVDVLLDACSQLASPADVVIAGDGPLRGQLEAQATKLDLGARFAGVVAGEAKAELLSSASVIVLPSREIDGRTEGMPVAALEALSTSARVIVSLSGGLAELPGRLVDHVVPGDSNALATAISSALCRGPVTAAEQRERDAWTADHSWEVVGKRLFGGVIGRGVREPARSRP